MRAPALGQARAAGRSGRAGRRAARGPRARAAGARGGRRGGPRVGARARRRAPRDGAPGKADRSRGILIRMRISVAADDRTGVADAVVEELRRRGHEPLPHGALADGDREDWAWCSEAAARDVAEGRADQAVVCCWTGTGASIAANKVAGIRAALCADAETARGARKWNDANVLALSLRTTSPALLSEILDGWFEGEPSSERDDLANVQHVNEI